jgi:hypothetical protein
VLCPRNKFKSPIELFKIDLFLIDFFLLHQLKRNSQ